MSNELTTFLRGQFQMAHGWLQGTMQGLTPEQAHWVPIGKPNPIGAQFGHVVTTEDFFVNMVNGQPPLMAAGFAGKTGLSELPAPGDWTQWAHTVKVDLEAVQAYAQAVFNTTDSVLASLTDEDLKKPLDLNSVGFGMQNIAFVLNLLILNCYSHSGEISTLKGLQGLKGYTA